MLEVIHDTQRNIEAVLEYLLFNESGTLDDNGTGMFIGEAEINPKSRNKGLIKEFIKRLLIKYPKVERCIFYRKIKYPNKEHIIYTRKQFERLIKE